MAKQLSAEEISIFRDCFNEYDTDKGGNITVEEFARVMRKTNPSVSDEEVSKIISEVDLDGDGTINFDEFITMMTGQPYKSPEPACGRIVGSVAAFRGVSNVSALLKRVALSPGEVEQVAAKAGLAVTAEDVEGMIDPANGEGKITYEKFLEFVKRQEVDDIVSGYE
ncbi:hypothetical protein INS49_001965 [Diaporthe citri]|uniref:uncharacterized protein n=1 Tax=Diaporthe citri TaxID=83186 RepID=UPI001C7F8622|nr:uncharacterized protein INS49_001965 [Diaporthe citri]KAG6367770.1 hypothetical protein INS49_001965 [Diaporthe citri]